MPDKWKRGSETDEYGQPIPPGQPSPREVRAALELIQSRWTARELRKRLVQPREAWTVPVVKTDHPAAVDGDGVIE